MIVQEFKIMVEARYEAPRFSCIVIRGLGVFGATQSGPSRTLPGDHLAINTLALQSSLYLHISGEERGFAFTQNELQKLISPIPFGPKLIISKEI